MAALARAVGRRRGPPDAAVRRSGVVLGRARRRKPRLELADVLEGAPLALIDSYERERRPHVAAMQRLATLIGGLVQSTQPWRVRARDAWLSGIDGTRLQRLLAENVKPLPTYGVGAFADRPARLPMRRSVGTLFPQTGRLDDELGTGWSALAGDEASKAALSAAGLRVVDPGADGDWLRDRGLTWAIRPELGDGV